MSDQLLRLSRPNLDEEAIAAAVRVLRSGQLVYGSEGMAFEEELQAYFGVRHAVLVSSGTAALHLALLALGIGPGDAVLVPGFSFPATGNAVRLVGAEPVFVDVDPDTFCVQPDAVDAAATAWTSRGGAPRLRAVMPVHEFGYPADMQAFEQVARRHGMVVVEDAACAIGADCAGRPAGTWGAIGCFSLHPRKTLTTGEGGILVTDIDNVARRLRRLRNHGIERGVSGAQFLEVGYNLRITDLQSAIGRTQLPHVNGWIDTRRALASNYRAALAPLAERGVLSLPADVPGHSWQTFMVVLADGLDRATLIGRLAQSGIEAGIGAQCLPALPPYGANGSVTPVADRLYRQGLALPFCEQYSLGETRRVVAALEAALQKE